MENNVSIGNTWIFNFVDPRQALLSIHAAARAFKLDGFLSVMCLFLWVRLQHMHFLHPCLTQMVPSFGYF